MGCDIEGFIGKAGVFQEIQRLSPCITVAPLAQGFEYLLYDWPLMKVMPDNIGEGIQDIDHISKYKVALGLRLSCEYPITFVEAYFSGGTGSQKAAVWHQGQLVLLPATNGVKGGVPTSPDAPINTALRFLGVQTNAAWDEYQSLGLPQFENPYEVFFRYNNSSDKDHCFDDQP